MNDMEKQGIPKDVRAHAAIHPAWRLRKGSAVFVGAQPVAPT
jgi:hypothetical protein